MSIITQLKLLVKLKPSIGELEQGVEMKNVTQAIAGAVALVTAVYQIPQVHDYVNAMWVAHPTAASVIGALIAILLTIHQPNTSTNGNGKQVSP